ncbi:MAG TPA: response regulator transcription factor [Cyclobacteriaceae bacterium]|nr:response regulator transcription factor [Cyclobacteriaceae bacterium]
MNVYRKLGVCIVGEYTLMRKGIALLLESFSRVGRVSQATNERELIRALRGNEAPDLVLIDADMQIPGATLLAGHLYRDFPEVKIVAVGVSGNPDSIVHLIESGVHGCLLRSADETEIEKAIYSVVDNDFYQDETVSKIIREHVACSKVGHNHGRTMLSVREQEILQLICKEYDARQIGEMLYISEKTVHAHRLNILKKTKVKGSIGLIKFALANGFLTLTSTNEILIH